jgi:protein MAK16
VGGKKSVESANAFSKGKRSVDYEEELDEDHEELVEYDVEYIEDFEESDGEDIEDTGDTPAAGAAPKHHWGSSSSSSSYYSKSSAQTGQAGKRKGLLSHDQGRSSSKKQRRAAHVEIEYEEEYEAPLRARHTISDDMDYNF